MAATPRLCFFGTYNKTHRNNSLLKGLRAQGYEVIECYSAAKKPWRYFSLIRQHWQLRHSYDVMIVGFPNHGLMLLARVLTRRPIIFDPFISLFNTIVEDRQQKASSTFKARRAWWIDTLSVRLADWVLFDTAAHAAYFQATYGLGREKCVVVPVGADESQFVPAPAAEGGTKGAFRVKFYGSYSPLQGVQYIIEAARRLQDQPDIHFELLGHGQTLAEMKALAAEHNLTNLTFIEERISLPELVAFLQTADVCLGIFGGTVKSNMVVPHKVYDALALGKPVITADTPAIAEFFTDREHLMVCRDADGAALADTIVQLRDDAVLRNHIATEGRKLLLAQFTPVQLVRPLVSLLERI